MPLVLPPGRRIAVSISADFCAHSLWMGMFGSTGQGHLSRGEFGAYVGVERLLNTFKTYGITTTWCVPAHTLSTFTHQCEQIVDAGHEIAAHGLYHEKIGGLSADEERRLLERQLERHVQVLGMRPRGYRSPSWEHTDQTLTLLEEFGFDWDSSLMGRDFLPYRPRTVEVIDPEGANVFGPPSSLLEIPVSWFLDDFPVLESIPRSIDMASTESVLRRWIDHFDFAYQRLENPVITVTIHPETAGRAHVLLMLERFLEHIVSHEGVWFAPLSTIADTWQDEPSDTSGW